VTALAVIVPTRGRPGNAARLAEAFRETDTLNALVVFVADIDDPELPAYRDLLDSGAIPRLMVHGQTGGTGLGPALNYAARKYAGLYENVGFMGDDHLPRTCGWEDRVLEELDSLEPRIVYGNDLLQGPNLPTAVFMQSRIVQALGCMAPSCMRHLYLDNFWKHLGETLGGLVYLPDVIIEHLHPVAGKAAWDERYAVVNASGRDLADRTAWENYRDGAGFEAALKSIRREYGDARPAA
jgi:hypothetical protein